MKRALAPLTHPQFALTAASVAVSVMPHLPHVPWLFSLPIALMLVGRYVQRLRTRARLPIWIKLPLIVAFPVLIVVHYGNIFGREPGSVLACAMLTLKLLETETRRDAHMAIAFSAFVLMSALLFDSSLLFTLALLAALALLLAALREVEPRPPATAPQTLRTAAFEGLRASGLALFAAVPLAFCVFFFFPRLGSPMWGAPTDAAARTGLGDRMAPGSVQELLIDDSPAFRVVFHGPAPTRQTMYWRGPVLSFFDGNAWSRPEYRSSRNGGNELHTSGGLISYQVTLEPSDRRWMLALDMPISAPENAVRGADMSLVRQSPVDSVVQYEMTSATRYELDTDLDPRARNRALELPREVNPRARELALGWRSRSGDDDGVIRAALDLFHEKFFYTLNAPELTPRDTVDDFLFETQRGFCEHFASAFTFLMRAAGIPARVVTGYQGGYYNDVGDYWVVRQSDAHAWSEVWLEGRGWVRVDPTAAVSPQRVDLGARAAAGASAPWYQADWLQAARNQFDLVNRLWNNAIVQFNALRQQSLLTPFGVDNADFSKLMGVLVACSGALLALFAWWVLRTPRRFTDPLDAAYARLRAKLAKAGVPSADSDGPLTLAARMSGRHASDDTSLTDLFADYVQLRYARAAPADREVKRFAQAVASLRLITVSRAK
jgi:transglutaminase-like putative cysteine protease